jgi:AcrR family transcriptional regulator
MPSTNSRHRVKDRRQHILRVAASLFARQGFRGTTTRQIAAAARVNEAIIFRHFARKEDLYWAVIERKCQAAGKDLVDGPLGSAGGSGRNVREVFGGIAEEMLRRQSKDTTLTRLLLFSALESHRLSHRFFRTYVADCYDRLADYIREQIRGGAFRPVDPYLAARGFLGMIIYHFMIQELFGGKRDRKFDLKQVSTVLTDIWLGGILDGHATDSEIAPRVAPEPTLPESASEPECSLSRQEEAGACALRRGDAPEPHGGEPGTWDALSSPVVKRL